MKIDVLVWLLQRITGGLLLGGFIVHFYTMHYSGPGQIKYEVILSRLSSPYWIVFNFLFLISVIYHGFNGLLGIISEYVHSRNLQKILEAILIVIGLALVGLGVYILAG